MSGPPGRTQRRPVDRGLPHSWETERSVLGALLMAPERLPDVQAILAIEDWHRPAHAEVYGILVDIARQGGTPDHVALLDEVERRGCAEAVGGLAYVATLPTAAVAVDYVESAAKRIRDYAVRRGLVLHARALEDALLEGVRSTAEVLDEAGAGLARLAASVGEPDLPWMGDIVDEQLREIDARCENPGAPTGIPTGFVDLDRKLAGLQRSDLVILAARPAMGKTGFVGNLAVNMAKTGHNVGIFELEMSRGQLVGRMLCSEARVDASRVRVGELTRDERISLDVAGAELRRLPLYIDDTPGLSLLQFRARVRAMDRRARAETGRGLDAVVVDYLQLMTGTGRKGEIRENVISEISRGMKMLAKEMSIPVIALSQLNRGLESRQDKRPMPSDLRESGAIEQDADVILFIYRDEVYNGDASPDRGIAEIIIAKQRSGPIGTVKLAFVDKYVLFQSLARPAQEAW